MDTFCPLGPAVVPKQYINPEDLNLKTVLNGKEKQCGNTNSMVFKIPFLVSYLSQ